MQTTTNVSRENEQNNAAWHDEQPLIFRLPNELLGYVAGAVQGNSRRDLVNFCRTSRKFFDCGKILLLDNVALPSLDIYYNPMAAHCHLLKFMEAVATQHRHAAQNHDREPRIKQIALCSQLEPAEWLRGSDSLNESRYYLSSSLRASAKQIMQQSRLLVSTVACEQWYKDLVAGESDIATMEQVINTKGRQVGLLLALMSATKTPRLEILYLALEDMHQNHPWSPFTRVLSDPIESMFGVPWHSPAFDIKACFPKLQDLSVLAENFVPCLLDIPQLKTLRLHGLGTNIDNQFLHNCPSVAAGVTELEFLTDASILACSNDPSYGRPDCSHQIQNILASVPNVQTLRFDVFVVYHVPDEHYLGGRYSHVKNYVRGAEYQTIVNRNTQRYLRDAGVLVLDYPRLLQTIAASSSSTDQLTTLEIRTNCSLEQWEGEIRVKALQTMSPCLRGDFPALRHLVLPEHALVVATTAHECENLLYYALPEDLETLLVTDATIAVCRDLLGFMRLREKNGGLEQLKTIELECPHGVMDTASMLCEAEVICEHMAVSGIDFVFTVFRDNKRCSQSLAQLRFGLDCKKT
jgi:hypothetical protein